MWPSVSYRTTVFTMSAFAAVAGLMLVTPWACLLLPVVALARLQFSARPDCFGLSFACLLVVSFSYQYSLGAVPNLVWIIRGVLIVMLGLRAAKVSGVSGEYGEPMLLLGLFLGWAAFTSYRQSMYVDISLSKVVFVGLFLGGVFITARRSAAFPAVLFAIIAAIALLSAAAFFLMPGIGYAYFQDPNAVASAAGKFSGIMNHPQLLAGLLAVNLPLLLYAYFTARGGVFAVSLAALGATAVLLFASSSRTGMLATLVALGTVLFLFGKDNPDPRARLRIGLMVLGIALAAILAAVFAADKIQVFIYKTEDVGAGVSLSGRDNIMGASWRAFLASPLWGNGFGVPSDFTEHAVASFGMSSESTAVEKCFFGTMLLEEVGFIGTALFLVLIFMLLKHWVRKRAYLAVAAMLAFLTVNVGEACILSPSSIGGLCWLSIFAVHNLTFPRGRHDPR